MFRKMFFIVAMITGLKAMDLPCSEESSSRSHSERPFQIDSIGNIVDGPGSDHIMAFQTSVGEVQAYWGAKIDQALTEIREIDQNTTASPKILFYGQEWKGALNREIERYKEKREELIELELFFGQVMKEVYCSRSKPSSELTYYSLSMSAFDYEALSSQWDQDLPEEALINIQLSSLLSELPVIDVECTRFFKKTEIFNKNIFVNKINYLFDFQDFSAAIEYNLKLMRFLFLPSTPITFSEAMILEGIQQLATDQGKTALGLLKDDNQRILRKIRHIVIPSLAPHYYFVKAVRALIEQVDNAPHKD